MLKIQEYLKNGKTLQNLETDFAISYRPHSTLPLIVINYSQIDSPKTHPIVMEARSLILEKETWNIVSKSFLRFFNLNEALEITSQFNWSNYRTYFKEDGSLVHLYWYNGFWRMNTRSTDGSLLMTEQKFTWAELFWKTLNKTQKELNFLDKSFSYIFELCSPYNQCVTLHTESKLVLLDVIKKDSDNHYFIDGNIDSHNRQVDLIAKEIGVHRPKVFDFTGKTQDEIRNIVNNFGNQLEGIVLQDCNGLRIKLKNLSWLALSRLSNNNNFYYKDLIDLVWAGEDAEVIAYYPLAAKKCEQLKEQMLWTKLQLQLVYENVKEMLVGPQKEFALQVIKLCKDVPSWPLFSARRDGLTMTDLFSLPKYADKLKEFIVQRTKTLYNQPEPQEAEHEHSIES